jgi:hypothetical protein
MKSNVEQTGNQLEDAYLANGSKPVRYKFWSAVRGSRKRQRKRNKMEDRSKGRSQKEKYDPHFTDSVIAATGRDANPRLKQIMPSLLRHLHDFAREVDLTLAEWMAGVEMVSLIPTVLGSPGLLQPLHVVEGLADLSWQHRDIKLKVLLAELNIIAY